MKLASTIGFLSGTHILFAAECAVRQRTEQCVAEADPKVFLVLRLEKAKTLAGGLFEI
jgi:hypothetical protein